MIMAVEPPATLRATSKIHARLSHSLPYSLVAELLFGEGRARKPRDAQVSVAAVAATRQGILSTKQLKERGIRFRTGEVAGRAHHQDGERLLPVDLFGWMDGYAHPEQQQPESNHQDYKEVSVSSVKWPPGLMHPPMHLGAPPACIDPS